MLHASARPRRVRPSSLFAVALLGLVGVGLLIKSEPAAAKNPSCDAGLGDAGLLTTTCPADGKVWEKLTCHNPSTCLDAEVTCKHWDVCDCCSDTPLYKCLLPTAEKYFAPECSFPVDGRQQCCGDAVTHKRSTDVERFIVQVSSAAEEEARKAYAATKEFVEETHIQASDNEVSTYTELKEEGKLA